MYIYIYICIYIYIYIYIMYYKSHILNLCSMNCYNTIENYSSNIKNKYKFFYLAIMKWNLWQNIQSSCRESYLKERIYCNAVYNSKQSILNVQVCSTNYKILLKTLIFQKIVIYVFHGQTNNIHIHICTYIYTHNLCIHTFHTFER
jgi:hypothetical protein